MNGLSDKTLTHGDTENSKVIIFHLHGAVGSGKNITGLLKGTKRFIKETLHVAPSSWDIPQDRVPKEPIDTIISHVYKELEEVIKTKLPSQKLILHGNSFGGTIALTLADIREKNIDGLILNSSSGFGEVLDNRFGTIHQLIQSITSLENLKDQRAKMKEIISILIDMNPNAVQDYMIDDALKLGFQFNEEKGRYSSSNRMQLSLFGYILKFLDNGTSREKTVSHIDLLRKFAEKKPVLIIGGENDTITPPAVIEQQADIASTTAVIIPKVGHSSHMEAPDTFIGVVNEWLEKHVLNQ